MKRVALLFLWIVLSCGDCHAWRHGVASGGGEYANLSAPELAAVNVVVDEFATNGWHPDPDAVSWDDTITVTTSLQLDQWFAGTSVSGVTINVARNQRVRLDPGGTWTPASIALIDIRDKDYLAGGKTLLIEALSGRPIITSQFTVFGSRGVYFRTLAFAASVTTTGGDLNWNPGLNEITVSGGGTGYTVGDTFTVTGGAIVDDPTFEVATVNGSGAILTVTVTDPGATTSFSGTTVSPVSVTGTGATFSGLGIGNNPRDAPTVTVTRSASFPKLSVVWFDDVHFGARFQASPVTDPLEYIVGLRISNAADEVVVKSSKFYGYQTGISAATVRRFKVWMTEFQGGIGDATFAINNAGNALTGANVYNTIYPDKLVYYWSRLNTMHNIVDDCAIVNGAGENMLFSEEHTDFWQLSTGTDTGGYKWLLQYGTSYVKRVTYQDYHNLRVTGGAQGVYLDDGSFAVDGIVHDSIVSASANVTFTAWNGTSYAAYVTGFRPGSLAPSAVDPPDAFDYTIDPNPLYHSRKLGDGTAPATSANVRNIIVSGLSTSTSPPAYIYVVPTQAGVVLASPRIGTVAPNRYQDVFVGDTAFTLDGEGRTVYSFTDNASVTPAQLRSSLWGLFAPKVGTAGSSNPATWPAQ